MDESLIEICRRIEIQTDIDRLAIDRSESSFGGKASLTAKEIARGNELMERARQVTAW